MVEGYVRVEYEQEVEEFGAMLKKVHHHFHACVCVCVCVCLVDNNQLKVVKGSGSY